MMSTSSRKTSFLYLANRVLVAVVLSILLSAVPSCHLAGRNSPAATVDRGRQETETPLASAASTFLPSPSAAAPVTAPPVQPTPTASVGILQAAMPTVNASHATPTSLARAQPSPTSTAEPALLPPFGVTVRSEWNSASARQLAVDAGVRWARTSVSWAALEPEQGAINLSGLDAFFLEFQRLGIIPIVFISENPAWAASTTCGLIDRVPMSEFGTFMLALGARYDGDADYDDDGDDDGPALPEVDYWELYNEPDNRWVQYAEFGGCWGNHGAQYGQLLAVAWEALHHANPNGQLGFSGLAAEPNPLCDRTGCAGQKIFNTNVVLGVDNSTPQTGLPVDFVDGVLNYMVANPVLNNDYFDFLDFHSYPAFANNWDSTAPYNNAFYGKAQHYKLRMEGKGIYRYLLSTEAGRPSADFKNYFGVPGSDEEQSRYVVRLYAQAMKFGLRAVLWFSYSDVVEGQETWLWGLLNASFQPKPSYVAYSTLTRELSGLRYKGLASFKGEVEGYVFSADNRETTVLWAKSGSIPVSFRAGQVTVTNLRGEETTVLDGGNGDTDRRADGSVTLAATQNPVFVRRQH